jgi:membrane-associated phospholipid phosphatase
LTAETGPQGGTTPLAPPRPPPTRTPRTPEAERLLPAAATKLAWLVAACCAVIVAGLPLLFGRRGYSDWLDRTFDHAVKAMYGSGHYHLLTWLASPGTLVPIAALIVIIAACCLLTRRTGGAALAVISVPAAVVLTEHVLKPLVNRSTLGFSSYPSGHACSTFAIATVLAIVLFGPLGRAAPRALRLIVTLAGLLVACVVSTAVIALGWHYCTDTIGGAAIAICVVTVTALVLDWPAPRRLLAAADSWLGRHVIDRYRGGRRRDR